MTLHHFGAI